MLDLNRLFENWFSDPEFSVAEKLSFADDTRQRIAQNNTSGVFDTILVELNANFIAAGGATGSEAVALAVRKAGVAAKRDLLDTIRSTVRRREGKVINDFGKGSPQYLEFFPQGLKPYNEMNEAEVEGQLAVLIAAGGNHDATLKAEFGDLKTNWLAAKKAAGEKIAAVSGADLTQDQAMTALELTLMKVIFTAALAFVGNNAMGPVLFDQSRLENKQGAKATPASPGP